MNRLTRTAGIATAALAFGAALIPLAPVVSAIAQTTPAKVAPADLTGTWKLDPVHTEIGFVATHLGVSKTRGRFTDFDGTLNVDGVKPEKSSVDVSIKIDSISTGNPDRDKHLKSPDFFDAAKYPTMTFKSNSIKKSRTGEYVAMGNLTIKAVTKPVMLRFKPTAPIKLMGKLHAGLSTSTTINRQDYGLVWNQLLEGTQAVGNEIVINIDMEAVKQ